MARVTNNEKAIDLLLVDDDDELRDECLGSSRGAALWYRSSHTVSLLIEKFDLEDPKEQTSDA